MKQYKPGSIVVGVDVGGPRKGFHAVALQDGQYREQRSTPITEKVAAWCRRLKASVVGIDAPCRWSLTGRARPCERALAAEGLHTFATPSQAKGRTNPFYQWMVQGVDLYRCLAPDYPLFEGKLSASDQVRFETFPHAVACALARKTLSAGQKRADRSRLLREAGVSTEALTNIDWIDAAPLRPITLSWAQSRRTATLQRDSSWFHSHNERLSATPRSPVTFHPQQVANALLLCVTMALR